MNTTKIMLNRDQIQKTKELTLQEFRKLPEDVKRSNTTPLSLRLLGIIATCEYILGDRDTIYSVGIPLGNRLEQLAKDQIPTKHEVLLATSQLLIQNYRTSNVQGIGLSIEALEALIKGERDEMLVLVKQLLKPDNQSIIDAAKLVIKLHNTDGLAGKGDSNAIKSLQKAIQCS